MDTHEPGPAGPTMAAFREGAVDRAMRSGKAGDPSRPIETDSRSPVAPRFTPRQREIAIALAEAYLPPGNFLPGAGAHTIDRLEAVLARGGERALRGYGALLETLDLSPLLSRRRRFRHLPRDERERILDRHLDGGVWRQTRMFLLGLPLKAIHFDDPDFYRRLGCVYDKAGRTEPARWMQQIVRAPDLEESELEADVVVVGTGAGGAVVAKELAERGLAVVMLEEGEHFTRKDFNGRALDAMAKLYRSAGQTVSLGNAMIPIPLGKTVGGTTTVNSGTCFRTPDRVLQRWVTERGLAEFSPEAMAPYFDRVEHELGVAEAKAEYVGAVGKIVARGCDRLGWSHHALRRNAPDCDGQGVCVFGCPTDAKRSTNVSYVPMALERSALLVTAARAESVRIENGRAAGIEARAVDGSRRLRVRARAVVLACGTLLTPPLLMRQGLLRDNPHLGRHLTIHPAIGATGTFEEEVKAYNSIPQGYCVDEFARDGIMLEGGSASLDTGGSMFNLVGRELIDVMERYDRIASFGAMVCEHRGAGRVRLLPGGRTLTEYWVSEDVRERLQRAMVAIGRILFTAGATRVYPTMTGVRSFASPAELDSFARSRPRARDFLLTAYHPLGTCRVGRDAASGVVDTDHQAFGLPGLYICDGGNVPTSPEVNPQVTIMAMATRAAERLAGRLA